jgi:acyl-CoA synthetase (NDP forming)
MSSSSQRSSAESLKPFLYPRSVAVIGTSRKRTHIGYRIQPPADIKAIEDTLLRTSHLVEAMPGIAELDLNPAFALPEGQDCIIVDARIRLGTSNDQAYRYMIRTHRSAVIEGGT